MAYRKSCDACEKLIDRSDKPFLQIHLTGSISEQVEYPNGDTKFRYLSERPNQKFAFCDENCLADWIGMRRKKTEFQWLGKYE